MPSRTLELQFPLGGVNKRLAFQTQRPFTTPHALNVRPEGTLEKRLRGGSRPGLVKSFLASATELPLADGNGNPIRLLTVMRSLNSEGRVVFAEPFDDDPMNSTNWEAPSWVADGLPDTSGLTYAEINPEEDMGAILKTAVSGLINVSANYTLEVFVALPNHVLIGKSLYYKLFTRMDDTTPLNTDSVSAVLRMWNGPAGFSSATFHLYLSIEKNDGTVIAEEVEVDSGPDMQDGWVSLTISPERTATAKWKSDTIDEEVETDISDLTAAGQRAGFQVDFSASLGTTGSTTLDDFRLRYMTADNVPPEAVVAVANGKLYREGTEGSIEEAANQNADLNSAEQLLAVDYLGKLYIADFSDNRTKQTDGATASVVNGILDDSDVSDWTDLSIDKTTDMVELTGGTSGAEEFDGKTGGVYGIDTIHATNGLTLKKLSTGSALGASDDLDTPEYRVLRGPKRYDSNTDTLDLWPADDMPLGCRIIEIFRERIVLGGDPENPGVWFMSRFRDPLDWNYGASATDRGRAIASVTTTSDAGGLALPLSAIVAGAEDYCLFSAESELYLLRGDPTVGGILGNISRQIGIGSRTAWCRLPDGSVAFLSRDGLYGYHPSQPSPQNISRDKLPVELIDVVQNTDLTVTMEYDVRFQGILIFIVPATAGPTTHYWFDWTTKSFWPEPLGSSDYEPFALAYDAKANRVLLAGRDGYIRHHDAAAADDDGTAVAKQIDYGPIPLNRGLAAMADSLKITLDDASDDVLWTFRSGDSPEEAFNAATRASGTAKAGVNYVQPVRHHDQWGFLRLFTSGAAKWAVEAIELYVLTTPARARKI